VSGFDLCPDFGFVKLLSTFHTLQTYDTADIIKVLLIPSISVAQSKTQANFKKTVMPPTCIDLLSIGVSVNEHPLE